MLITRPGSFDYTTEQQQWPSVISFLAASGQNVFDLVNLGVGSGATALAIAIWVVKLFLKGDIDRGSVCQAEREARMAAEAREREALQRVDRAIDTLDKAMRRIEELNETVKTIAPKDKH